MSCVGSIVLLALEIHGSIEGSDLRRCGPCPVPHHLTCLSLEMTGRKCKLV